MPVRLSQSWCDDKLQEMELCKKEGKVFRVTTAVSQAKRFLVLSLVNRGIPFKVLNQGCGVSTITTETDICPKCKGTGRI